MDSRLFATGRIYSKESGLKFQRFHIWPRIAVLGGSGGVEPQINAHHNVFDLVIECHNII